MYELPGLKGRALFKSFFQRLEGGHEPTDVIARHVLLWKVLVDACERRVYHILINPFSPYAVMNTAHAWICFIMSDTVGNNEGLMAGWAA
jgi:hypothetical protein